MISVFFFEYVWIHQIQSDFEAFYKKKKSRKSTRLEATLIIYINISKSMSVCTSIGVGPQVLGGRQQCPVPSLDFLSVNSFKGLKWLSSFAFLERGYDLLENKEFPSTSILKESPFIRVSILKERNPRFFQQFCKHRCYGYCWISSLVFIFHRFQFTIFWPCGNEWVFSLADLKAMNVPQKNCEYEIIIKGKIFLKC